MNENCGAKEDLSAGTKDVAGRGSIPSEVIIIGGGPAGLTAGLYTARAKRSGLLIEKGVFGS